MIINCALIHHFGVGVFSQTSSYFIYDGHSCSNQSLALISQENRSIEKKHTFNVATTKSWPFSRNMQLWKINCINCKLALATINKKSFTKIKRTKLIKPMCCTSRLMVAQISIVCIAKCSTAFWHPAFKMQWTNERMCSFFFHQKNAQQNNNATTLLNWIPHMKF